MQLCERNITALSFTVNCIKLFYVAGSSRNKSYVQNNVHQEEVNTKPAGFQNYFEIFSMLHVETLHGQPLYSERKS